MANQDVKRLGPNNRKGFIGRFCSAASSHPEAIAFEVVEKEQKWTYAQMLDLMEQFRAAFEKLEIEEGEMIMVLLPSCPEFIASIYALTSLSMISIPTNYLVILFHLAYKGMAHFREPISFFQSEHGRRILFTPLGEHNIHLTDKHASSR